MAKTFKKVKIQVHFKISLLHHYSYMHVIFSPVLLSSQHFNDVASEAVPERVLQPMRWGLIPSWFHGNPKEFSYNMSNARSDSLLDKKSFRTPLETGKRCVILAEG